MTDDEIKAVNEARQRLVDAYLANYPQHERDARALMPKVQVGQFARRLERQAEWWDDRAINCTEMCRTLGCVNPECPGERS